MTRLCYSVVCGYLL